MAQTKKVSDPKPVEPKAVSADDNEYVHTGLDDPDYDHVDPRTDAEIKASKSKAK